MTGYVRRKFDGNSGNDYIVSARISVGLPRLKDSHDLSVDWWGVSPVHKWRARCPPHRSHPLCRTFVLSDATESGALAQKHRRERCWFYSPMLNTLERLKAAGKRQSSRCGEGLLQLGLVICGQSGLDQLAVILFQLFQHLFRADFSSHGQGKCNRAGWER
jgi:hypothetical protein